MNLAEIKAMIEAEAVRRQAARDGFDLDAVKAYLNQSTSRPQGFSNELPPPPSPLTYRYFADLNYQQMVTACYLHLLRRAPDPGGANHWLTLLCRGEDKAFVVGRLAYSDEARKAGAHVSGLTLKYYFSVATKVPVAGAILAWLKALLTLHKRERAQRAFEQHMYAQLGELADHSVHAGQDMALRIDALRNVLETRH
jgi:hypothetical protein